MFNDPIKRPPRRFTPEERETEKQLATWMHRPQRHFFDDPPTYPWLPLTPLANFDLNYKE